MEGACLIDLLSSGDCIAILVFNIAKSDYQYGNFVFRNSELIQIF